MLEILIAVLVAALCYVLGANAMRTKMLKQIEGACQQAYLLGYGTAIMQTTGIDPTVSGDATVEHDVAFDPEAYGGKGGYS